PLSSVALVAEQPRGLWREAEARPHRGRQVLRALLQTERGHRGPMITQERERELRPLLAHLAQHPADRFPDEELTLIEHPSCEPGEEGEVSRPARQGPELRQERGAPDPEAGIARQARQSRA